MRRRMRDHAFCRVHIMGRCDHDLAAICPREGAAVAGLAAGGRVEHRPVEHDAALADLDDAARAMVEIRLLAEQAFGHHRNLARIIETAL